MAQLARIIRWIAVLAALLAASLAQAHPLAVGTSRITLRDAHIEVQAQWDVLLLTAATPTALATMDDAALAQVHAQLRAVIADQSQLQVDGQRIPLQVTGLVEPAELRAVAAQLSASGQDHGTLLPVRLEAPTPVPQAREVALTVPAALGPTLTSFVQPASQMTVPGDTARFAVLGPVQGQAPPLQPRQQTEQTALVPSRWPQLHWAIAVVAMVLVAGLGRHLAGRRRNA